MLGKSASQASFVRSRLARFRRDSAVGEPTDNGASSGESAVWGAGRDGARTVATRAQVYALLLLAGAYATLLVVRPQLGLIICLELVAGLYFATGLHKVWLLVRGDSVGAGSKRVAD